MTPQPPATTDAEPPPEFTPRQRVVNLANDPLYVALTRRVDLESIGNVVWRTDFEPLYRHDNRGPESVFNQGFGSWGHHEVSLIDHVAFLGGNSAYVSTTRQSGFEWKVKYINKLWVSHGIDLKATERATGSLSAMDIGQGEVTFPGGLGEEYIEAGRRKSGENEEWELNPNFKLSMFGDGAVFVLSDRDPKGVFGKGLRPENPANEDLGSAVHQDQPSAYVIGTTDWTLRRSGKFPKKPEESEESEESPKKKFLYVISPALDGTKVSDAVPDAPAARRKDVAFTGIHRKRIHGVFEVDANGLLIEWKRNNHFAYPPSGAFLSENGEVPGVVLSPDLKATEKRVRRWEKYDPAHGQTVKQSSLQRLAGKLSGKAAARGDLPWNDEPVFYVDADRRDGLFQRPDSSGVWRYMNGRSSAGLVGKLPGFQDTYNERRNRPVNVVLVSREPISPFDPAAVEFARELEKSYPGTRVWRPGRGVKIGDDGLEVDAATVENVWEQVDPSALRPMVQGALPEGIDVAVLAVLEDLAALVGVEVADLTKDDLLPLVQRMFHPKPTEVTPEHLVRLYTGARAVRAELPSTWLGRDGELLLERPAGFWRGAWLAARLAFSLGMFAGAVAIIVLGALYIPAGFLLALPLVALAAGIWLAGHFLGLLSLHLAILDQVYVAPWRILFRSLGLRQDTSRQERYLRRLEKHVTRGELSRGPWWLIRRR